MTIPYKTILQSAFLTVITIFVPAAFLREHQRLGDWQGIERQRAG